MPDDAAAPLFRVGASTQDRVLAAVGRGGHLVITWIGLGLAVLLLVFWSLVHRSSS
jgi:hypothetical protein